MRGVWWLGGLFAVPLSLFACGDDPAPAGPSQGTAGADAGGGTAGRGGGAGTQSEAGSGGSAGDAGTAGKGGSAGNTAAGAGGKPSGGTAGSSGTAAGSAGTSAGGSAGTSAAGSAGTSAGGSAGAAPNAVDEVEPNGGATLTEVNPFTVGTPVKGRIGSAGDADIFALQALPGKVYVVKLTRPAGSKLSPHLAVFDAGRNDKPAGDDYTKIALANGASDDAVVELLAMGEGGYFIGVRDERNVDDPKKGLGDADFTYQIDVTELAPSERVQGPLALPGEVSGTFAFPGALHLFSFDIAEGQELSADFAPDKKGLDGRFYVYAAATKDWAARNDNRSASDPSPRFDQVPLQPAGAAYLVVENIDPTATSLGYTVTSK